MSNLQIGEWIKGLEGSEIEIPSVEYIRQAIAIRYSKIILKNEELTVASSPFKTRFYLPVMAGKLSVQNIESVEGFVSPENIENSEMGLVTADLTHKNNGDFFVISPSKKDLQRYGNLRAEASKYLCIVEYSALGNNVTLKLPQNGEIDLTGNADW